MSKPNPDSKKCKGSGRVPHDVSHLGGGDWNPGVVWARCECWPPTPEEEATLAAFLKEIEDE